MGIYDRGRCFSLVSARTVTTRLVPPQFHFWFSSVKEQINCHPIKRHVFLLLYNL